MNLQIKKYTSFFIGLQRVKQRLGSVVECLTRDRGDAGSSFIEGTAFCPLARHFILCLVMVQPRKTHPDMSDSKNVDWDVKNQIQQTNKSRDIYRMSLGLG